MRYQDLIAGSKRFGSTELDICRYGLSVEPEQIHENVVIAPWWEPAELPALGEIILLSPSEFDSVKVWDVRTGSGKVTYIKTGIGAPVLMDALLTLGVTPCRKAVFIGSVGSLDPMIGIGDVVLPQYTVCGDGASRYLSSDLEGSGFFGEKVYPDRNFFERTKEVTANLCEKERVTWHVGRAFSIDTIFAQFTHIGKILEMGCNVIEMETASAFRAAELMGLPLTAVFVVSDNTVTNKSLVSGRTPEEHAYRIQVKSEIVPRILLELFR